MTPGLAGFPQRPATDSDLLVCMCGATLGTRALKKPENARYLEVALADHDHVGRLLHQSRHRTIDGKCPEC